MYYVRQNKKYTKYSELNMFIEFSMVISSLKKFSSVDVELNNHERFYSPFERVFRNRLFYVKSE